MVCLRRLFLILFALGFGGRLASAADVRESTAFTNAMETFRISRELSVQDFADFIRKYPNSVRVPEAILREAQGMLYGGDATNAIRLLSTNRVDKLAPQYLYWLGQAYFQEHDYAGATNTFGQMIEKFPKGQDALDATIRQANALVCLEQWPLVVQLLSDTNKPFQGALGTISETMASGFLLLGEAQLVLGDNAGVENTLRELEKQNPKLNTTLIWQRDYLAARLQRAEGRLEDALKTSDNLIGTLDRTNRAQGVAFQGGVYEQLGNLAAAANAFTNNLAPEAPADQQRRAILKIAELDLVMGDKFLPDAVQRLTKYLETKPQPEASDFALLMLGEVRMKQAALGETNLFENALAQFATLINSYPTSAVIGKAWLDQGWCLWSQGKIAASQESFRNASDRLAFSVEQAEARFKWADTQIAAGDFGAAVTNYNAVAEKYESLPEARERRLIERALYQSARAALNEHNLVASTSALKNILAGYPNGFAGPSVLLFVGQEKTDQNDPAGARELFSEFQERYPESSLSAEVRLAIGRSFEVEGNWDAAITNYSSWSGRFTNHYLMPQAQFRMAWDQYMAGRETNALMLFTNFVARYPSNELSARAQFWVGDYYYRQGDSQAAEINYKAVFQNTNWPVSELTYEARISAARAAVFHYYYRDAVNYFLNLFTPDCPQDVQVRATIGLADAMINEDSTNKTADLLNAIGSLKRAVESSSNNWQAAQAWGRIGDCFVELGAKDPSKFIDATNAYLNVIESPTARDAAKDEARFNLAATMEKQAALKSGDDQTKLLKIALHQYVAAFNQGRNDPDGASAFWTKRSGSEAARLAESLQDWDVAINMYGKLKELLPGLAPTFDKKIQKIRERR